MSLDDFRSIPTYCKLAYVIPINTICNLTVDRTGKFLLEDVSEHWNCGLSCASTASKSCKSTSAPSASWPKTWRSWSRATSASRFSPRRTWDSSVSDLRYIIQFHHKCVRPFSPHTNCREPTRTQRAWWWARRRAERFTWWAPRLLAKRWSVSQSAADSPTPPTSTSLGTRFARKLTGFSVKRERWTTRSWTDRSKLILLCLKRKLWLYRLLCLSWVEGECM